MARKQAKPRPRRKSRRRGAGWGARRHTIDAEVQLPRKIPVKLEPKTFFAVERTFLSWAGMATTLAATASVLTSLAVTQGDLPSQGPLSRQAVAGVSLLLSPLAFLMLGYAFFMYHFRSHFMRNKEVGFYDDRIGPLVLAVLVAAVLCGLTVVAFHSVFSA